VLAATMVEHAAVIDAAGPRPPTFGMAQKVVRGCSNDAAQRGGMALRVQHESRKAETRREGGSPT